MNSNRKETNAAIIKLQKISINADAWRTCLNCDNFAETKYPLNKQGYSPPNYDKCFCLLNDKRPPTEVIVTSCECWEYRIPF